MNRLVSSASEDSYNKEKDQLFPQHDETRQIIVIPLAKSMKCCRDNSYTFQKG